jgi:LEA14-like dessication related protein
MKNILLALVAFFVFLSLSNCQTSIPAVQEPVGEPVREIEPPAVVVFENIQVEIEIEIEKEHPVPQPPQIEMASMKIENINSNRAEILVTINVENSNVFEIPSPRIIYDYQLNRNSFIRGIIESDKLLAASSTTPVVFSLLVHYADLYRSNRQLRTSNLTNIPSLLIMTCDFDILDLDIESMHFEIADTLPLMR